MKYSLQILFLIYAAFSSFSLHAQDIEFDKKMGAEGAKAVAAEYGIDSTSATAVYVNKLGQNLVSSLVEPIFEYKFYIADSPEPNAFALPGGYIYVTRGLLALANSEDELAGVIGHEIIHAYRRHSIKQMKKSILPSLLQLPGKVIGAFSPNLGQIVNAPISGTSKLFLSSYGRKNEKEADEQGIGLAGAAGYDPLSLSHILGRLALQVEMETGKSEKQSYFSDHPFTPKRVAYIESMSEQVKIGRDKRITKSKNDFLTTLNGLWFGDNPAHGIIVENNFLHPSLKIGIQFPKQWQTTNSATAVGAFTEDGEGLIVLSIPEVQLPPKEYAEKVNEKLENELKLKASEYKEITINGMKGQFIGLQQKDKKGNLSYISLIWLQHNGITYQLVSAFTAQYKSVISTSSNSFRALSDSEVTSISGKVIQVAQPNKGEDLAAFSTRAGNIWSIKMTALANGIPTDYIFNGTEKIKIVIETPYKK